LSLIENQKPLLMAGGAEITAPAGESRKIFSALFIPWNDICLLDFAKVMELQLVYHPPLTPPSPPFWGERRKVRGAI
jgi:hypothetical protein